MTPVHYTTTDLYEATYLMIRGCELFGITRTSAHTSTMTFTYPRPTDGVSILKFVQEYRSYDELTFSPRVFAEKREELKRLIKSQPEA